MHSEALLPEGGCERDRLSGVCSLTQVLASKFGYSNIEEMKKDSQKRFSLLESGILDQPSTRLLLINVMPTISTPFEPRSAD